MKTIISAAMVLVVLIGMAFGGMALFKVGPFEPPPGTERAAPKAAAKPSFIKMETLPIPIIHDRELQRRIDFTIKLTVDPDKKDRIYALMPRLQNAFLSDMMAFMPLHMRNRKNADITVITQRLMRVSEKTLGSGTVRAITIDTINR